MFKKEEIKLIIYTLVASAYMTMFYDLFQEFVKPSIDWNIIWIKVPAGLISMGIGIGIILYFTQKPRHKSST